MAKRGERSRGEKINNKKETTNKRERKTPHTYNILPNTAPISNHHHHCPDP